MFSRFLLTVFFVLAMYSGATACQSCTIPRAGKDERQPEKKWFVEYLYERKDWKALDAHDAHSLHHDGHHVHDKTYEEFHHMKIGGHLTDRLTTFFEIPYVVRHSLETHDHSRLGEGQISEGIGDLNVIGDYRFFKENDQSVGLIAGIKFPTGETHEKNVEGERFEAELQPGSGAFDYIAGGVYQSQVNRIDLTANSIYVFTTAGAQDFEFGDLWTTSLFAEYNFAPDQVLNPKAGIDINYRHEQKQEDDGVKVADSGGNTILVGPTLKLEYQKQAAVFATFLFPVSQDLGGVHQELDYEWIAGGKVSW